MRQIQFCAWLFVVSAAVAACSGDKFTSDDSGAAGDTPPVVASGGSTNRGHGGSNANLDGSEQLGGESAGPGTALIGGTSNTSSGGSGAGGSYASAGSGAGMSASGGSAPTPSDCAAGTVKFQMLPGADLPHDYLCDAGCGTGWLSVTDAVGATAYSLFSACGVASCETCEVQSCVASACLTKPLTGEGSELSWNGNYFTKDTCGDNMACQKPACVKPGKYKAKACAAINAGSAANGAGCMPKNEMLCAEAEFEFPGTTSVKLVLNK